MRPMIDSPQRLREALIEIFPDIASELDDDSSLEDYEYLPPLTYHAVWMSFAPVAAACLQKGGLPTAKTLARLIDHLVDLGGDAENAVSTCFLEHASQVGVYKDLNPLVGALAKSEIR